MDARDEQLSEVIPVRFRRRNAAEGVRGESWTKGRLHGWKNGFHPQVYADPGGWRTLQPAIYEMQMRLGTRWIPVAMHEEDL